MTTDTKDLENEDYGGLTFGELMQLPETDPRRQKFKEELNRQAKNAFSSSYLFSPEVLQKINSFRSSLKVPIEDINSFNQIVRSINPLPPQSSSLSQAVARINKSLPKIDVNHLRELQTTIHRLSKTALNTPITEINKHIKEKNDICKSPDPFNYLLVLEANEGKEYVNNLLIEYVIPAIQHDREIIIKNGPPEELAKEYKELLKKDRARAEAELLDKERKRRGNLKGTESRNLKQFERALTFINSPDFKNYKNLTARITAFRSLFSESIKSDQTATKWLDLTQGFILQKKMTAGYILNNLKALRNEILAYIQSKK